MKQEVRIDMPDDSPELMFGLNVYNGATISMSATFYVNNIILDLAGQLSGVEHLIIGKGGEATLRCVILRTRSKFRELKLTFLLPIIICSWSFITVH